MTVDHETLSRLLGGELAPEEAARVRAEIATDPDAAARWQHMQRLATDLAALPDHAAPPALDAVVLRPSAPARGTSWTALAAAAALVLAVGLALRPLPVSTVSATAGLTTVEGRVDVVVGPRRVAVDGRADVVVEPVGGPVRDPGRPPVAEASMDRRNALSALAGAAITITVYEGRARLFDGGDDAIVVEAGETHRTPAAQRRIRMPPPSPAPPPVPDDAEDDALRAENAALRAQLEEARIVADVARGQLATYQGDPQPWPADLPEGWDADSFEQAVERAVADVPGARLELVDCEEFPCLAGIVMDEVPDDPEAMRALTEDLTAAVETPWFDGVDPAAMVSVGITDSPDGARGVVGLAFMPPDPDDGLRQRIQHRYGSRIQDLERDVEDGMRAER